MIATSLETSGTERYTEKAPFFRSSVLPFFRSSVLPLGDYRRKLRFTLIALICTLAFSACFSPWRGDDGMGTIVIGPGGGQNRTVVPGPAEVAEMNYTVVFSGPGGTRTEHFGPAGGTIQLVLGTYRVSVRAVNDAGRLRGLTEQSITIAGNETHNIVLDAVIGVKNFDQLKAALTSTAEPSGGSGPFTDPAHPRNIIVLEDNIDMTAGITVSAGTFTLVAEPEKTRTLTRDSVCTTDALIGVSGGIELTLGSAAAGLTGNIVFDGNNVSSVTVPLINVNGGKLTMNSGVTLKRNMSSGNGGGVVVSSGDFTMNGGTISGNTATTNGGGVWFAGTTFTMSGTAEISGNTASNGGGVYVNAGNFYMEGGTIGGSKAADKNTAGTYGGGVYFNSPSGTFKMTGGTISGNEAADNGGGVNANSGNFTMEGDACISGNTTTNGAGGGVCFFGTTFTLKGHAVVSGNKATGSDGGGVYASGSGNFTMSDNAVIKDNEAAGNGGGVYGGAAFLMGGGNISGNRSSSNGAGVYVASSKTFTINSPITTVNITGNTYSGAANNVFNGGGTINGSTSFPGGNPHTTANTLVW